MIDFKVSTGELLHIDILSVVLGLKSEDVKRLAVAISSDDFDPINVMHPLLVLESRCINLDRLSGKRHANGITQARVACLVVQKYLEECLQSPARRREALDAAQRLAALAQSQGGVHGVGCNSYEPAVSIPDTSGPTRLHHPEIVLPSPG